MNNGGTLHTGDTGLIQKAEKALALSPGDFRQVPVEELQALIKDLLRNTVELESHVRRMQESHQKVVQLEKQCSELHDFAPVGYFSIDDQDIIVSVNFTACDMLGHSKESLLNTPFINLVDPKHHQTYRSYLKEIRETGQRLSCEIEMMRLDGSTFHAQLQTVSLYEKSSITFRLSIADISKRKEIEKELAGSEQRYRDLADLFPEPIFETDTHGRLTYANLKTMGAFDVNASDIRKGVFIFEFVVPEERSVAVERFRKILEQGGLGAHEYTLMRKDGSTFASLVHSERIERDGEVIGLRGVAMDVTERKRAERAVRESEARLAATMDSMLEGCQIINREWRYAYVNEAVARQGRRAKEDLIGRTMMEMYPGFEKTELFARLRNSMENRVPHTLENEFAFPDGSKGWFEIRVEPVTEGILVFSVDVTERKLAEARMKKGIEKLEYIHGATRIAKMLPVGLLMIEHRLIERVLGFLSTEKARMEGGGVLDRDRMRYIVDFFRTYTDGTHHGKEEQVLFKALGSRRLTEEHTATMNELAGEHAQARSLVESLYSAAERVASGDLSANGQFMASLGDLIGLYPKHIQKEEKAFFPVCMSYFSPQEQNSMLLEFWEFDRQMIHLKYTQEMELLKRT